MDLFPNLYGILVGPPGSGKSIALAQAERMLRTVTELVIAPTNVSSASLIDALSDAKRRIVRPSSIPNYLEYNAITAIASELGVFLPAYEPSFINLLTKVYDGEPIEDRKRTRSVSVKIDKPIFNFFSGTTPSYLNDLLPEGAWDQGFTSRSILIYCGERRIIHPLRDDALILEEGLHGNLLYDLKSISAVSGRVTFESNAVDAITDWHTSGGQPVPKHGKLLHYIPRRTAHVLKLCIINTVSRGSLIISLQDFQQALDDLTEAESFMPEIFKSMGSSGDAMVSDDTWDLVFEYWTQKKAACPERVIIGFISRKAPYQSVLRIIELMVRSGRLEVVGSGTDGKSLYKPGPKHPEHIEKF